jgi:hypothetical protein
MTSTRPTATRRRRVASVALAAATALTAGTGCSKKGDVVQPPPVVPGAVRMEGNRILWTTDQPALGSVRYTLVPGGAWDHCAYPDAAGRVDRSARTDHSVALLDVRPGQTVYVQTASEVPGQAPVYSAATSFSAPAGQSRRLLTSTMIHIGFGDSHLITMPNSGKRFLYDSGGRDADLSVSTYMQQHGITSLDAMLGTHEHVDHMGGLVGSSSSGTDGVVGEFAPDLVYDSAIKADSTRFVYRELLETMATAGAQRVVLSRGQTSLNVPALQLDPEVLVQVLNSGVPPDYVPVSHEDTNVNNDSMVLRFTYGDVDFVIGGDCEFGCENSILGAFPAGTLEVEYFKATHHGLSDANGPTWVATLLPRVGFIPNTEQVWDPPQDFEGAIASTTTKLLGVGAHIYAIDEARSLGRPRHDGMGRYDGRQYNVSFVTDGRSYEVRIELATQPTPALTAQESGCIAHAHAAQGPAGGQH